jgi:glycosyltransferase involved in cell wall biosynthesis
MSFATRSSLRSTIASRDGSKPLVVVIGPFPPPIHGVAAATQFVAENLRRHVRLLQANLSIGSARGAHAHIRKSWGAIKAIICLLRQSFNGQKRVIYMAVDGGLGKLYNITICSVAAALGYKIFLHHHSYAYIYRHSLLMDMLMRVGGAAATHVMLSEGMVESFASQYRKLPKPRTFVLSCAAFVNPPTKPCKRQSGLVRIGFFSNLIIEKGVDTTVDLLRAARKEGLPVKLMLAGHAPDRRAIEFVNSARAEFGEVIEYEGPLSEEQKIAFYTNIDIFVFPTRYVNEAEPRVVIEALSFGRPVLSVARGCIAKDVGKKGGICVPINEDFVSRVLPRLCQWCQDRALLERSCLDAYERGQYLYNNGLQQMATFRQLVAYC